MTDTRTIYLRLQSPRLNQFCQAFEKKIIEGWRISSPARAGATMFIITLEQTVSIDSPLPAKALWNCKPEYESEVLEEAPIVIEKPLPDNPYPPLAPADLLPTGEVTGLPTGVADIIGGVTTDRPEETNSPTEPEQKLETETINKEVAKSQNGFIIKAYSLEEVQKLSWQDLTKINADLGLEKGKKIDMEVNIVEASKIQWGEKNA